jgi:hypothetical protein
MWTILKLVFVGAIQALFSFFRKSSDERAGIAETTVAQQAETIKEARDAKAIRDRVSNESIGSANQWLHHPSYYD